MQTSYKKEIQENDYLFCGGDTLLDKRFKTCLKWYIRKACQYRSGYYFCTLVSGIFPFVVAAVNSFNNNSIYMRVLAVVLSTGASISVVVLTTYRLQEKWMRYRMAAEFLKRERIKYLHARQRDNCDHDKLDAEFLQTIEQYMEEENADWQSARLKDGGEMGVKKVDKSERKKITDNDL